jgi:PAS domain S-box-containing protein
MNERSAREAGERLVASHASEDPFAAAIKATRMPMLITDPQQPDNPIIFCNDAFLELTGYGRDEVVGHNCRFLQGTETDRNTVAEIRDAVRAEKPARVDILNYRKDGTRFWNALYLSPVKDTAGRTIYFFASQLDITDVKEREAELAAARDDREREVRARTAELRTALEAKTVLLHEVDHRVKNNLLTIASIVKLQARRTDDKGERRALHSVLKRVEALSTVQRRLFVLDDVSRFDVAEFARDLSTDLLSASPRTDVSVDLDLSPVMVPAAKASPIALIVNEVVTDAIRNAAEEGGGHVKVIVRRLNGHFQIRVEDDGVAKPGGELGPDTFGRVLVETCARQVQATVTWESLSKGSAVDVRLPVEFLEDHVG